MNEGKTNCSTSLSFAREEGGAERYWAKALGRGGVCLAHELLTGRAYEIALWRILLRQALHWLGPIVAVKILFMQHASDQMAVTTNGAVSRDMPLSTVSITGCSASTIQQSTGLGLH